MPDLLYTALIGDVIASRHIDDRPGFQAEMLKMLKRINGDLGAERFAAPLTLTAGDECQALLRRPCDAVEVIQKMTDWGFGSWRFPYLAFGIGLGVIATGTLPAPPEQAPNPALLDGPCFHAAREALREAKVQQVWARFQGFGTDLEGTLNALFDLMGAIRSDWAPMQGIYSIEKRLHHTQRKLALDKDVRPSVVSESLKAAHHSAILDGEQAARGLLESVDRDRGSGQSG